MYPQKLYPQKPSRQFVSVLFGFATLISSSAFNGLVQPGIAHDMPGMQHSSGANATGAGMTHTHKAVEVPPGQAAPTVNLVVHPDAMNGWNLEVKVTNFTFAPERVNTKSTSVNEGHAHLYIDGKKLGRLYGNWYHLSSLPPGNHTITVALNTNDHGGLMYQGKPIQASQAIAVPQPKP